MCLGFTSCGCFNILGSMYFLSSSCLFSCRRWFVFLLLLFSSFIIIIVCVCLFFCFVSFYNFSNSSLRIEKTPLWNSHLCFCSFFYWYQPVSIWVRLWSIRLWAPLNIYVALTGASSNPSAHIRPDAWRLPHWAPLSHTFTPLPWLQHIKLNDVTGPVVMATGSPSG